MFCIFLFIAAGLAVAGAISASRGSRDRNVGALRRPDAAAQRPSHSEMTAGKIAPWVLEHTANGQRAEFIVVLTDQADLSGAAALTTKMEKGRYVYEALREQEQDDAGAYPAVVA